MRRHDIACYQKVYHAAPLGCHAGVTPAFPWQQSLGLVSPAKNSTHAPAPHGADPSHSSWHSPISPQDLFGHPARPGQWGFGQSPDQGASTRLPAESQHASQHHSRSSSILPGSQLKASWQPSLSRLPLGVATPSTERAGSIGSAFSAWAPAQPSRGHSMPSMQASNTHVNSNLIHRVPAVNAMAATIPLCAAPSLPPSCPLDGLSSFPPLHPQLANLVPSASLTPGLAPPAPQAALRLLPDVGLPYGPLSLGLPGAPLPNQNALQLPPASPVSTAVFPALHSGIQPPAFPALLPPLPMLPGMPNLSSQWPLSSNLSLTQVPGGSTQPLPFPPYGCSMAPHPLGFSHMPPQLPLGFQTPVDPNLSPASSAASLYLPSSLHGLHHLPLHLAYHLPPYPPHPLQTLTASQPQPFGQLPCNPPSTPTPLVRQEAQVSPMHLRAPLPEQHPSHIHTLDQLQLPSHSWHQAAGMLSNGDRYTPAWVRHEALTATNLALSAGRSLVKLEQMPAG